MGLRISMCSICLCLCLYQITLMSNSLSFVVLVKVVFQIISVIAELYYICYCSEALDDCHAKLHRAIINSGWYRCSNRMKQDVCFLLRRLQRPNHLKFNQGFIILTKDFFVKVLKVSYNFVNFLRLKTVKKSL
uniref:Uncharacterized protein n=1 Tax=Cacopsylla melanoneura TaxID=428564 RepID=A0A8D8ZS75_9HEMI